MFAFSTRVAQPIEMKNRATKSYWGMNRSPSTKVERNTDTTMPRHELHETKIKSRNGKMHTWMSVPRIMKIKPTRKRQEQ